MTRKLDHMTDNALTHLRDQAREEVFQLNLRYFTLIGPLHDLEVRINATPDDDPMLLRLTTRYAKIQLEVDRLEIRLRDQRMFVRDLENELHYRELYHLHEFVRKVTRHQDR